MKTTRSLLLLLALVPLALQAQFHTLKMPKASPSVTETQTLGVTDITVSYHSPAVRERDLWGNVVPMNGEPIPWRAGANMNTTITFSTDVEINGQALDAGTYGFHAVPTEGNWTLLFAHSSDQWGSYYLDRDNDVSIEVEVTPTETNHSEQLDYEFVDRTDSTVVLALEWGTKRVPFTVSVDLNATVIASLRSELRGINTYHWQSWNDAARWCLNRNTNLEEALAWANRSIGGGYGGFAADQNFSNMSTKADILWALDKRDESDAIYREAIGLLENANAAYSAGRTLSLAKRSELALEVFDMAMKNYGDQWFIPFGYARTLYEGGQTKQGIKEMEKVMSKVPENYQGFANELLTKMNNGEEI